MKLSKGQKGKRYFKRVTMRLALQTTLLQYVCFFVFWHMSKKIWFSVWIFQMKITAPNLHWSTSDWLATEAMQSAQKWTQMLPIFACFWLVKSMVQLTIVCVHKITFSNNHSFHWIQYKTLTFCLITHELKFMFLFTSIISKEF